MHEHIHKRCPPKQHYERDRQRLFFASRTLQGRKQGCCPHVYALPVSLLKRAQEPGNRRFTRSFRRPDCLLQQFGLSQSDKLAG